MVVYHRGDTVETVSVEVETVEPILYVREQEVFDPALAVVEGHRVPIFLVSLGSGLGVEVVRAVEGVDALVDVLNVVSVYEIHYDGQPHAVCRVDEAFELLGRAET